MMIFTDYIKIEENAIFFSIMSMIIVKELVDTDQKS